MLGIVAGCTASGKKTVLTALVEKKPRFRVAKSWTTRPPTEQDRGDYHFTSPREFTAMVARGAFLEYAVVHEHHYGTPYSEVDKALQNQEDVILEIDCDGAAQVRRKYPTTPSVFILPPSFQVLEERLRARGREKREEQIKTRLNTACMEIHQVRRFSGWIVNDDLETAVRDLDLLLHTFKLGELPDRARFRDLEVLREVKATFPRFV